ncbi:MAG: hypothetical protein IKW02_01705 [Clostridia bacterium]|nr:hypothetical protein [Clostridia bacterium]
MSILLWILAFLGVGIIYGSEKLMQILPKLEPSEKTVTLIKLVGVLLSAAALVLLWTTGSFN